MLFATVRDSYSYYLSQHSDLPVDRVSPVRLLARVTSSASPTAMVRSVIAGVGVVDLWGLGGILLFTTLISQPWWFSFLLFPSILPALFSCILFPSFLSPSLYSIRVCGDRRGCRNLSRQWRQGSHDRGWLETGQLLHYNGHLGGYLFSHSFLSFSLSVNDQLKGGDVCCILIP